MALEHPPSQWELGSGSFFKGEDEMKETETEPEKGDRGWEQKEQSGVTAPPGTALPAVALPGPVPLGAVQTRLGEGPSSFPWLLAQGSKRDLEQLREEM